MRTIIDILEKDHDRVRELLSELSDTTTRATKTRPELLAELRLELEVHTKVEEELFYPAIRDAARNNSHLEMLAEAIAEHRAVDRRVLPELLATDPTSPEFGGRAKALKDLVEHHAEEEESEMFPLALELLSEQRLHELGEQLMGRKQQLLRKLRAA